MQSQFIERRIYSLELRHKICKEHIIDGVKMADLVRKYELSCQIYKSSLQVYLMKIVWKKNLPIPKTLQKSKRKLRFYRKSWKMPGS